jgi:hypothetical protein
MRGLVLRGMMFGTLDGHARIEAIRRFEKGEGVTDTKPDLIKVYQDTLEKLIKEDKSAYRRLKRQWDACGRNYPVAISSLIGSANS